MPWVLIHHHHLYVHTLFRELPHQFYAHRATTLPKNMKIVKATYGAENKTVDVTKKLKEIHANGFKKFTNYNSHFGDPINGTVKKLSIIYKANGKDETVTILENTPIKLK